MQFLNRMKPSIVVACCLTMAASTTSVLLTSCDNGPSVVSHNDGTMGNDGKNSRHINTGDNAYGTVTIYWEDDGTGVVGANIYDETTNELLGQTDANGNFAYSIPAGHSLRLVEPEYGVQQASTGPLAAGAQDVPKSWSRPPSTQQASGRVIITWDDDGSGVEGANVYNDETNVLLGRTNAAGVFEFSVPAGTSLRLVEPQYGVQQAVTGALSAGADQEVPKSWTRPPNG